MEGEGLLDFLGTDWDNDGVSCVVSACATRTDVHLGRKYVHELSFAFIAPLGAEDDGN